MEHTLNKTTYIERDFCTNFEGNVIMTACSGDDCYVNESFCACDFTIGYSLYRCADGCVNGACTSGINESDDQRTCKKGEKVCLNGAKIHKTAPDCEFESCPDSNSVCCMMIPVTPGGSQFYKPPTCQYIDVEECVSTQDVTARIASSIHCDGWCGASLFGDTCRDSDGGFNYYEAGKAGYVTDNNMVNWQGKQDFCTDSKGNITMIKCQGDDCYVREAYCITDLSAGYQVSKCDNGCQSGKCLREPLDPLVCCEKVSTLIDYEGVLKSAVRRGAFRKSICVGSNGSNNDKTTKANILPNYRCWQDWPICPGEPKVCPDGKKVWRTGFNCEIAQCIPDNPVVCCNLTHTVSGTDYTKQRFSYESDCLNAGNGTLNAVSSSFCQEVLDENSEFHSHHRTITLMPSDCQNVPVKNVPVKKKSFSDRIMWLFAYLFSWI